MITQGVEGFSREAAPCEYMARGDYQAIYDALVKVLPDTLDSSHRHSLKRRFEFGYQASQRKRIKTLLTSLAPTTATMICDKADAFVTDIVETRNYLTHRDSGNKATALDGADLYWASEKLLLLFRILLLRHCGIDESLIANAIRKHYPLEQIAAHSMTKS